MEYVIVDCKHHWLDFKPDSVLVVQKDRPEWQKGRLNLPGGKIEGKETPEEAAVRELGEETGYTEFKNVQVIGKIVDGPDIIHCVSVELARCFEPLKPQKGETEEPIWIAWSTVRDDPRLIPNLRVIIPLLRSGVPFEIHDQYRSKKGTTHSIQLALPDPGGENASQDSQLPGS